MAKPKKQTKKQLRETAYHEAGHAVAAYCCQIRFKEVTIIPDEDSLGKLVSSKRPKSFQPDINQDTKTRLRIERETIVYFAGGIAERKLTGGKRLKGAHVDLSHAIDLLDRLTGGTRETEAYGNWLFIRAEYLVMHPWNWTAIEALAAELMEHKRIGYRRARQIIKQAIENYEEKPEDWADWE